MFYDDKARRGNKRDTDQKERKKQSLFADNLMANTETTTKNQPYLYTLVMKTWILILVI